MTAGEEEVVDPDNDYVIDQLKQNTIFSDFLNSQFDAQDYANTVIEGHVIGEALSKLNDGVDLLNNELLTQVSQNHEDLLSQATGIETLEGVLNSIQTRCQSLVKSVDRVKTQVTEPYNRIASRTRQLRRLQTTCDYLRRIIRILHLSKRLKTQMKSGSRELTKAAQTLDELSYVVEGVDLSHIDVVCEELTEISKVRLDVEKQGKQMLEQGLASQNQTLIGTALQVFLNLGCLVDQVNVVTSSYTELAEVCVAQGVDVPCLSSAQDSGVLWVQIEGFLNKLHDLCQNVFTLEKVLAKKRDPVTHKFFIDDFAENGCSKIFHDFWNMVASTIRSEFDRATQMSTMLKQTFGCEYPKLLRLFNDFWSKIALFVGNGRTTGATQSSNSSEIKIGFLEAEGSPLDALKVSLHPFEDAYISRSLSRLFDPVNLVFPSGAQSVPSTEDLKQIQKQISNELNVAAVDERLMILVTNNVAKTIKLYIEKCGRILVATADAAQLSGDLTTAQIRNVAIVNSLHQVKSGLAEILPNLVYPPQETINKLDESMEQISAFMDYALGLILSAVMSSLENKMARMHSETFSITTTAYHEVAETQPCSKYIMDIQDFITRVQTDYLSLYHCQDFLLQKLEVFALRLMELFVRHACLLRDLQEGGKLKLAADMAQLEFTITPLCKQFQNLGPVYKLFRAFKPLLFQSTEDIPSNPNLGESLPYSTVLHFLFSTAPPHMFSPHTVAGWTVPQYSEWLDQHTDEQERMALVKGTVEAFTQKVKSQDGSVEFPPVYHVMCQLIQRFDG